LKKIEADNKGKAKYYYGGQADEKLTEIYKEIATSMGKVSVSGRTFEDINEDGKFTQPPDASMSGVLVALRLASAATNSAALASVTSDANGLYSFTNLCAEKYRISQELKQGYYQTIPTDPDFYEIDVTKETENITDKDFGSAKGEINFTFKFALHGIGIAGDNVVLRPPPCLDREGNTTSAASSSSKVVCLSNQKPLHPERKMLVELINEDEETIASLSSTMDYDSKAGIFNGIGKILSGVKQGTYTFRVNTPMFLWNKIAFTQLIKPGETYDLPLTDMIAADVDNDNQLSILDYSLIALCYTYPTQSSPTCDKAKSDAVDTDDNGVINEFDVNLFVRELSERIGK
jgi:hypothetical protein